MAADPWFQPLFADRVGGAAYGKGTAIYKFEAIKRAKRQAVADRPDVPLLDFGIGENDDRAAAPVRERMKLELDRVENRGYADNGIAPFKEAAAAFMRRQFGVTLDPVTEVCHGIGTKPIYAVLPATLVNPGDVTLMTVPGYPVAGTWTRYFGGEVHRLPLTADRGYLPDLDAVPGDVTRRAKLLVLNYPNSPTGAVATVEFYKRVVEFAHRHQVVVVNDAAHVLLTFRGEPLSFLQVDGAKEVGVEVHSMSKGFDMIGWRMGWVCGHPKLIQAYADVKDNLDSGQFMATQLAAAEALGRPEIPERIRTKYRRRLEKLVVALRQVGFRCEMPGGSYFLYTPAPVAAGDRAFATAEDASQFLIREQSVCCVPWDDAGRCLRFAVTYQASDEAAEDALMGETVTRLGGLGLRFA